MGFRDTKLFLTTTAVVTRLLFIAYDLLVIWHVYMSKDEEPLWWFLVVAIVPVIGELVFIILFNGGREWNSVFCPGFFVFILSVIPQLWMVELNRIERLHMNVSEVNMTTTLSADFGFLENPLFTFTLSNETWALVLKEGLLYLLIGARWLLPVQHLTYAQLSDTLLLYIGMAADLMELMDLTHNREAMMDWNFVYALLGAWTLSLLQFTYVLVPTDEQKENGTKIACSCNAVHSEVLEMLLSLFMMYIPFAAIRVTALVMFEGTSYSSIFFLVKNMVMILLSFNRLIALFCTRKSRRAKRKEQQEMNKIDQESKLGEVNLAVESN